MPHSKDSYTPAGSDKALDPMMNLSLWNCQSCNLETTMLTEALAAAIQPREVKKPHSNRNIQLEIVMSSLLSSLLIGVALLMGIGLQTNRVETNVDIHRASQH